MWPKILLELLPHLAPAAQKLIASRGPNDADMKEFSSSLHQVTTASTSLTRQLQEQTEAITELQMELDQLRPAIQHTASRLDSVEANLGTLATLVRIILFLAVIAAGTGIAAVILLVLRHH